MFQYARRHLTGREYSLSHSWIASLFSPTCGPAVPPQLTSFCKNFSFVDLHALTLLVPHLDTLAMAIRLFNERTYLRLFHKFILLTHVCLRPHYVTPFAASIKQSNFLTVKCWVCTTDVCRSIPYLVIYPSFKRRLDHGLSCWHIKTWKCGW